MRKTQADTTIVPLLMNGLQGRMLQLPSRRAKKRELLVVYGWHASLEYWEPLARELAHYATVTMPDLPGFGGMQSFSKIHEKPSLDNLADYLAAFVKLRYRNKRFAVVGIAFGLVVVTRMLQRYPDLTKKVDVVISVGGLARYDDIRFGRGKRWLYRVGSRLLAVMPLTFVVRQVGLHPLTLRRWYRRLPPAQRVREIELWRHNDIRTHLWAVSALMKFDNCQQPINRALWHVAFRANRHLDHHHALQHLQVAYQHVEEIRSRLRSQSLGTIQYHQVGQLLPPKLKRALAQL